MKVLVDMNLSPRWVISMGRAGIQAIHWSEVGPANTPDSKIMIYARTHGFIVLTHDLDFGAILAATQGISPSVVQIRSENVNPDAIGRQVIAALRQMEVELEEGALLTIDPKQARMRLLPLSRGR